MTLRLRCVRCGEWDEMDPTHTGNFGLCVRCWHRVLPRFSRSWQKGQDSHPTYRALTAALDAMEAVPHGSLVQNLT